MRVVILGGGIAGLAAGWAFQGAGADTIILEAGPQVGGLASGFRDRGYTFDYFSHRLWTRDPEILSRTEEWIGAPLLSRRKVSRILIDGRFFNYPIDLRDLLAVRGARVGLAALAGYLKAAWDQAGTAPADAREDFRTVLTARYGRGLFDTFFGPYTSKLTGCPVNELSSALAREAIPPAGLLRQLLDRSLGRAQEWDDLLYPEAGFMAIPEGMGRALRSAGAQILLSHRATRLVRQGNRITMVEAACGAARAIFPADLVVSTIPVGDLLAGLDPPAEARLVKAASALRTRAMVVVYLGIARERVSEDHWIYVPDPAIRFNRLSETTNYSPRMAPPGRTGLCVEIACDAGDAVWQERDEAHLGRTVRELVGLGLLRSADEVEAHWVKRFRNAYPIYTHGYEDHLSTVESGLRTIANLRLCGRQGAFWYGSTAQGIRQGLDLAGYEPVAMARAA